jgi:hypothetical protein
MNATEILAVLAVVTGGLAAGMTVDRSIVALPAWRHLNVEAWAAFSRYADLGNGLYLYPAVGVSTWLLSMATAVVYTVQAGPSEAAAVVYAAAVVALIPVFATTRAVPNMLKVRHTDDDAQLMTAFAGFQKWNNVRAVGQTLGFALNVWALVLLLLHR